MPPLAGTDTIAGSRGCVPRLSAGVRSGSKALSYQGLALVAAPPPYKRKRHPCGGVFVYPARESKNPRSGYDKAPEGAAERVAAPQGRATHGVAIFPPSPPTYTRSTVLGWPISLRTRACLWGSCVLRTFLPRPSRPPRAPFRSLPAVILSGPASPAERPKPTKAIGSHDKYQQVTCLPFKRLDGGIGGRMQRDRQGEHLLNTVAGHSPGICLAPQHVLFYVSYL